MQLHDNVTIGILTKLNELAERHGLSPCDFVATVREDDTRGTVLCFEMPAAENSPMETSFNRLLHDLNVTDELELVGDQQIYSALKTALAKAPKSRAR